MDHMRITPQDGELHFKEDLSFYHQQIGKTISALLPILYQKIRSHRLLHITLLSLIAVELFTLLFCLSSLAEYALVSLAMSALFLTTFSYFILRLYTQTKKIEQLRDIHAAFLSQLKVLVEYKESAPECNIAVANSCCKFAEILKEQEICFCSSPFGLSWLTSPLRKWSSYCYWQDFTLMRELLLQSSVEEHIKWVKCEATSLEAHASLANAYVLLSHLYASLASRSAEEPWLATKRISAEIGEKFRQASKYAIEEFKILSNYAPNDPWVHEQLAYSYRDLQMPLEEIKQYELILKLNPSGIDILHKLGILYFQLGRNANGLQVYEQLKKMHYSKAENLIAHYDAYYGDKPKNGR